MIVHRSTGLITAITFFAILLIILSSSHSSSSRPIPPPNSENKLGNTFKEYLPQPKLPNLNNFRFSIYPPATHKPPEQKNSTSGASKWYSDWKWHNPFSSTITLDENRSVLPPLRPRPPIYTFYDSYAKKSRAESKADTKLLLAWRRAWFAQGFRPVVLGPGEAKKNPLYEQYRSIGLKKEVENNFLEWLAWGAMGSGILANWQCFPMAHYDDNMLTYLRRGGNPENITRLDGLNAALFSGEKSQVNDVMKMAFSNPMAKAANTIVDLIAPDHFRSEKTSSIAYYDPPTVSSRYPVIAEKLETSAPEGRLALVDLINSHLQTAFHNTFSSGIHILKPFPEKTTALLEPGVQLATLLSNCAPSLMPKSCPPNKPKCRPCNPTNPLKVTETQTFRNATSVFTIGAYPHPYTLASLRKGDDNVTLSFIRRETERDQWLGETMKDLFGETGGGPARVVSLKDAVAGDFGMSRGLWFTVENLPAKVGEDSLTPALIDELDWHFGFAIPRQIEAESKKTDSQETEMPSEIEMESEEQVKINLEYGLIEKARGLLKNKADEEFMVVRNVSEAWNLADTELWRFVRAYRSVSPYYIQN